MNLKSDVSKAPMSSKGDKPLRQDLCCSSAAIGGVSVQRFAETSSCREVIENKEYSLLLLVLVSYNVPVSPAFKYTFFPLPAISVKNGVISVSDRQLVMLGAAPIGTELLADVL